MLRANLGPQANMVLGKQEMLGIDMRRQTSAIGPRWLSQWLSYREHKTNVEFEFSTSYPKLIAAHTRHIQRLTQVG